MAVQGKRLFPKTIILDSGRGLASIPDYGRLLGLLQFWSRAFELSAHQQFRFQVRVSSQDARFLTILQSGLDLVQLWASPVIVQGWLSSTCLCITR